MAWNPNSLGSDDETEDKKDNTSPRRSVVPPTLVPHPPTPSERPERADRPERPPVVMWEAARRFALEQADVKAEDDKEEDEDKDEEEKEAQPESEQAEYRTSEQESETPEPDYAQPIMPPVPHPGPVAEQTPLTEEERAESDTLLQSATTFQTAEAMSGDRLGDEALAAETPTYSTEDVPKPETPKQSEYQQPPPAEYSSDEHDSPEPQGHTGTVRPPTPPAGPPPSSSEFSSPSPEPEEPTPVYSQPSPLAAPGYSPNAAPSFTTPDSAASQYEAAARAQGRLEGAIVAGVIGYFIGKHRANRRAAKTVREMKREAEKTVYDYAARTKEHIDAMRHLRAENQTLQQNVLSGHQANEAVPASISPSPETTKGVPPVQEAAREPVAPEINPFAPKEQKPDHYVRSEWLNIGVDKEGHAVASPQEYGRAFQEEIRQEQAGALSNKQDSGGPSGGGAYTSVAGQVGATPAQMLTSGQIPVDHDLAAGYGPDPQHRLQPPKKQVVSNIANPWFWLMLAIIIAAFFAAALI